MTNEATNLGKYEITRGASDGRSSAFENNLRDAKARARAAVGVYPALLNETLKEFDHPLKALNPRDGVCVVLLNDYIVARDLPTAYANFRDALQKR